MLFLPLYNNLFAQSLGPKLTAMGNNGVSVPDAWAMEINPAGISKVEKSTIALNYAKYLFSSEISSQGLVASTSFKNNAIGVHIFRYGFSAYNEIKAGFTYAKSFGEKLSFGINTNYHQIKILNYGQANTFSVDVGGLYQFNKQLVFGASYLNISSQKYNKQELVAEIPSVINIGLTYLPSDKIEVAGSVSKSLKQAIDVHIGFDYKLYNLISLRAGFSVKPFKQYAGIGLNYNKFKLDMATIYDNNLGYTPQIAMAYAF